MYRLRHKDGFQAYDRYVRFLSKMLKRHKVPHLGASLLDDLRANLRKNYKEWSKVRESYSEANDELYIVEAEAEDELRITHSMARTADRRNPALGLVAHVFPDKLAAELAPRGRAQSVVLRDVAKRIDARVADGKLPADHEVAAQAPKLRTFADAIEAVEDLRDNLTVRIGECSARIRLTKARIREQVEGTYGGLRSHFASRPRFVERFFRPRGGKKKKLTATIEDELPELPEALEADVSTEPAALEPTSVDRAG